MTDLSAKYRPRKFKDVVGQEVACRTLQDLIANNAQAYLFAGPSGTGKTTLARITADRLGCNGSTLMEIDAATFTGIDAMRRVQEAVQYRPIGPVDRAGVLLDEAHRLSPQAWDSLLKSIEEPPPHVVWMLCTTNPTKVPVTVKSRCRPITLSEVPPEPLRQLCARICTAEGIELPPDVDRLLVREAYGSARQLLVNLEVCRSVTTRKEAEQALRSSQESEAALELCRFLVKPGSWGAAMAIVKKLEGESPEGVRIRVSAYFSKVTVNSDNEAKGMAALQVLDAFSTPYTTSDNLAPLLLSIGRVLSK